MDKINSWKEFCFLENWMCIIFFFSPLWMRDKSECNGFCIFLLFGYCKSACFLYVACVSLVYLCLAMKQQLKVLLFSVFQAMNIVTEKSATVQKLGFCCISLWRWMLNGMFNFWGEKTRWQWKAYLYIHTARSSHQESIYHDSLQTLYSLQWSTRWKGSNLPCRHTRLRNVFVLSIWSDCTSIFHVNSL